MKKILGIILLFVAMGAHGQNPVTAKEGAYNGYALRITFNNAPPTTYVDYRIDSDGKMTVVGTGGDPALDYDFDSVSFSGTGGLVLHRGTTAQRLTTTNGMLRYNTTTDKFEGYEDGQWMDLITTGTVTTSGTPALNDFAKFTSSSEIEGRSYSETRSDLGLVIGTNVQAYDADLSTYAGITPSANVQTLLGSADYSAFRTSLGLVIGTNVQAWDADLDAISVLASTGLAVRSASNTWVQRTLTGTANELTVTNGDGVSGNPTISIPSALTFTGKTITGGAYTGATINNTTIGATTATTGRFTTIENTGLTASTLAYANASKIMTSLANASGVLTNNGSGTLSWATAATGDVTASSSFGTNNSLILADGTGKGVKSAGTELTYSGGDLLLRRLSTGAISTIAVKNDVNTGLTLYGNGSTSGGTIFGSSGNSTAAILSNTTLNIGSSGSSSSVVFGTNNTLSATVDGTTQDWNYNGNTQSNIGLLDMAGDIDLNTNDIIAGGSITATNLIGSLTSSTGLPISTGVSGLGTGVATALGTNVGSAGAFITFNGALGTPSSGTVTNLTGTASININGTVGATTPAAGTFTGLTSPTITGGSGTTQSLTYKTTTGVGAVGARHIFQVGNNGATEAMTILNSGAVGIGTASPQTLLHIASTDASSVSTLDRVDTDVTTNNEIGSMRFRGGETTIADVGIIRVSADTDWSAGASPTSMRFSTTPAASTTATERMRISKEGYVGINNTSPGAELHVTGNINTTGSRITNAYFTNHTTTNAETVDSDETLKKEIEPLENAKDVILSMSAIQYKWDETKRSTADTVQHYGFSAQEIREILPSVVTSHTDSLGNEVLGVRYSEIIPYLVEAIKDLNNEIELLKAK